MRLAGVLSDRFLVSLWLSGMPSSKVEQLVLSAEERQVLEGRARRRKMSQLWVPRTSSTSRDQAIFADHATDASLPPDPVLIKIDRFG